MWLLESEGDVFHGKRLWLRPGKRYIFGRTFAEAGGFTIAHKTISRKHLIINVQPITPGNGSQIQPRSKITVTDLKTKIGTLLNGTQIRDQEHDLKDDIYEIKLGHFEQSFRISWNPCVFSFSFTPKEMKTNAVIPFCQYLEPLDIKVLVDYDHELTTHVVARKRNTSKGLQALINGKYIVDYSFLDAVRDAADEKDGLESLLEKDFDAYWPDALQHLPARGQEPTQRSSDAYAPDSSRQDIFDGYTFVFFEQSQFDNLLSPITNGRGKALLSQADPAKTKVEDFIRYVKNVAGEKGLGEFEDGSEGKGVVVVRYQPSKGPTLEWYSNFGRQVSLQLDHRLVEQSEFLDAILNNDASVLRKPLEIEQSGTVAPPPTAASVSGPLEASLTMSEAIAGSPDIGEEIGSAIGPPARRLGRSRRTVTSRFRGFDDGFETPIVTATSQIQDTQISMQPSQTSGMFVSQEETINSHLKPSQQNPGQLQVGRKRLSPPAADLEDEDILDQLAPAAAGLKRRRLAEEMARRRKGEYTPPRMIIPDLEEEIIEIKPKVIRKELDVLEVARHQREKEETIARAEREALQEAMDGMDIDQIRNLVIVEEMEIKRPDLPLRERAHGDEGVRWEPRWNGRKNFKNFRRRGDNGQRLAHKVIVPLEEVKKKDFGIGDDYWLDNDDEQQRKKKGKGRAGGSRAAGQSQPQVASATDQNLVDLDGDDNIESPSEKTSVGRPKTLAGETSAPRTGPAYNKRIAPEQIIKPAPVKKARTTARRDHSDDSDDGLGFKFKKRK